jgi:hypothetical protein
MRIFFMCSLKLHREVVRGLAKRGIRFALLDVAEKICGSRHAYREWAPEADLLDSFALYAAKLPPEIPVRPEAVGEEIIRYLAPFEATALQLTDRRNYDSASVQDLRELFLRYAAMWQALLERHRPDAVVFHGTPHQGHDYVLYHLCRRAGIRTLIIERSFLNERLFFREHLHDCPRPAPEELQAALGGMREAAADGPAAAAPAGDAKGAGEAKGSDPAAHYNTLNRRLNSVAEIKFRLGIPYLLKEFLDFRRWQGFFSTVDDTVYGVSQRRPKRLRHIWYETLGKLAIRRGLRFYERHCIEPDLNSDFVYLALHFQPERTTAPDGGPFSDQLNVARLIAEALPEGWRLYVREHPRQFRRGVIWDKARSVDFYRRLTEIPRVSLVPLDFPSAQLTSRCRAAATVSGTTAWEAVDAGVPALVFGYPWYLHCPGVHRITDADGCRELLEAVAAGEAAVDPAMTRAYAHVLTTKYTFRGCFADSILALSELSDEENGELIADAVARVLTDASAATGASFSATVAGN